MAVPHDASEAQESSETLSTTTATASDVIYFSATGSAAHKRLIPLVPASWIDVSPYAPDGPSPSIRDRCRSRPCMLVCWENSPRNATKPYRDNLRCYSHLPNGTAILDCKWVLSRLLGNARPPDPPRLSQKQHQEEEEKNQNIDLAILETHCFRSASGFKDFARKVHLKRPSNSTSARMQRHSFRDLYPSVPAMTSVALLPPSCSNPNLWVVKDALANGAGGVWVVGAANAESFARDGPLIDTHRYVAQRYVWPPVLFQGRKCHVRVYALITADGKAYVHHRAFLHVANELFSTTAYENNGETAFEDAVHITNCCANSHNPDKFAGEICASFLASEWETLPCGQAVVPLADYFSSVRASVTALASRTAPYLQGGVGNHGFEYMGLDFLLSHSTSDDGNDNDRPLAYLLEVNAPPSQDTATGLPHAEDLHDEVLRDLLSLWIIPYVTHVPSVPGGWQCVYETPLSFEEKDAPTPSKAAILNKIRWALYERKLLAQEEQLNSNLASDDFISRARQCFPYFANTSTVYFENAGGTQVPQPVIAHVSASLRHRNRATSGAKCKEVARQTLGTILGAGSKYDVFLGSNATSLLQSLATYFVQTKTLQAGDEIVISTENHRANIQPWVDVAIMIGVTVKWWTAVGTQQNSSDGRSSRHIRDLLSERTKIVAVPHASNVLGELRDVRRLARIVRSTTTKYDRIHIVVDGVAAVPHIFAGLSDLDIDWYVVSCHKLFGPHLGALCGRRETCVAHQSLDTMQRCLESGTTSYEACAGIQGLGEYFSHISGYSLDTAAGPPALTESLVRRAYDQIQAVEQPLSRLLLHAVAQWSKVRLVTGDHGTGTVLRLPLVAILHQTICSSDIVHACAEAKISCRNGSFLCSEQLKNEFSLQNPIEGLVRFSLAHYNIESEVKRLIKVLESIPGWL